MFQLPNQPAFLLDMDGTLYLDDTPIEGAVDFIDNLNSKNIPYCLFTNNSSKSRTEYVSRLKSMGFSVLKENILTSGIATIIYLQKQGYKKVFLLGTPALEKEFKEAGLQLCSEEPDAVVLGFDKTLTYKKLEIADRHLRAGIPFVATHPDNVCPTKEGSIPDCGAMIKLLEISSGASPVIIGKPYSLMVEMASELLKCSVSSMVIVGDRLYTDMEMGKRSGMHSILVLSGEADEESLNKSDYSPSLVLSGVAELNKSL